MIYYPVVINKTDTAKKAGINWKKIDKPRGEVRTMDRKFFQKTCWCRCPNQQESMEYSFFRRDFHLDREAILDIAVSADSRYNLFLDGKFLGRGPTRGDLEHYHFEEYRVSVEPGDHVLAAEVLYWQDGMMVPYSEIHYMTSAFLCAGTCGDIDLSTPGEWLSLADLSRKSLPWRRSWSGIGLPIPPMEELFSENAVINWNALPAPLNNWIVPEVVAGTCLADACMDPAARWKLTPSEVPQMTAEPIPGIRVIRGEGLSAENGIITGTVPAGKHTYLLDLGKYYTAVYHFKGFGGNGLCRIAYAESLWNAEGKKRDRGPGASGTVGGKGYSDLLHLSGKEIEFHSFWFRAGRYVELTFETETPFRLDSLKAEFTHAQLKRKKGLAFPKDPVLAKICETAWHTLLCCAHEHLSDCPYYEQLQYVGDVRIQALILYEATADERFGRQAIRQFDHSRIASGLTASRYPSNFRQVIPEFSLFWIMMIDDHYRFFTNNSVIAEHWNGIRDVLEHFEKKRESSGLIGYPGDWNFSDWVQGWPHGVSNRGEKLPETLFNLIYAESCRIAADLAEKIGIDGSEYREQRLRTLEAVNELCYENGTGLYTDVPGRAWYSQHVQAWAILSGAAPEERREFLKNAILSDERLAPCTFYFSFYLLQVMEKLNDEVGMRKILERWEKILDWGFTTFPERPTPDTRSDCHAWSSGPLYFLLRKNFSEKI